MPYDEGVAQRIREMFDRECGISEKRMFGGQAFMLRGNMCCGVVGDTLMARVGPEHYLEALRKLSGYSIHEGKMSFFRR